MIRWYLNQKGKAQGPFTTEQILEKIETLQISPLDYLFKTGDSEWRLAQDHPEFTGTLKSPSISEQSATGDQSWVVLKKCSDGQERKFLQKGPYAQAEVKNLLMTGEITYFDFIWRKGFSSWKRIGEVTEFLNSDSDHTHLIEKSQDGEVTIEIDQPMRASSSAVQSEENDPDDPTSVLTEPEHSIQTLALKVETLSEPAPPGVKDGGVSDKGTATYLFEQSDYEDSRFSFDPEENNRLMRMPRPAPRPPADANQDRVDLSTQSTEKRTDSDSPSAETPMLNHSSELQLNAPPQIITKAQSENELAQRTERMGDLSPRAQAVDMSLISQSKTPKRRPFDPTRISKKTNHRDILIFGIAALVVSGAAYLLITRKIKVNEYLGRLNLKERIKPISIASNNQVPSLQKPSQSTQSMVSKKPLHQAVVQAFDQVKGAQRPVELQKQVAMQTGELDQSQPMQVKVQAPIHHEVLIKNKEMIEPKRLAEPARKRKPASHQIVVSQTQNRLLDVTVPSLMSDWVIVTLESVEKKIVDRPSAYIVMRKKIKDDYGVSFEVPEKVAPNGAYSINVKYGTEEINKSMKFGLMDSNHARRLKRDLKKNSYYFIRDKKWCIYGSKLLNEFLFKLKKSHDGESLSSEWKKIKLFKLPKPLTKKTNRIDADMGYPHSVESIRQVVEATELLLKKNNVQEVERQMDRLDSVVAHLKEDSIF